VFDTLRKAAELAEEIGDERRQGRVLSYLAQSFRLVGDYPRSIEAGERALAISRVFGDFGILAPANFHLGQAFFHLGDHRRAAEFHFSNIQALDGKLARDRLGMAGIPWCFARPPVLVVRGAGPLQRGRRRWQEAMKLAKK
jgi:tetratricopeptide (TPR) repeat protein